LNPLVFVVVIEAKLCTAVSVMLPVEPAPAAVPEQR
jgi:hypothetical protein